VYVRASNLPTQGRLIAGARVVKKRTRWVDQRALPVLFGKADHAIDHFRETRLHPRNSAAPPNGTLVFSAVTTMLIALRYELPANEKGKALLPSPTKLPSFRLGGANRRLSRQYLENYQNLGTSTTLALLSIATIRRGTLLDLPLTFSWADNSFFAGDHRGFLCAITRVCPLMRPSAGG